MRSQRIHTGTNLLDFSIHWLSQRQRVIHFLDFPTCMEWLPTWELYILRDSHQTIFKVCAPPGHQTSIAPPPPPTTTVTMASHTGISVSATLGGGYLFSGLYAELSGLSPIEELSGYSTSNGYSGPTPMGQIIYPMELPLERVFPGNIPTGLTKFILLQKRSRT